MHYEDTYALTHTTHAHTHAFVVYIIYNINTFYPP